MAALTVPDPLIKFDWRGVRFIVGTVSTDATGGHMVKEALRLGKVRGAAVSKMLVSTASNPRAVANSQSTTDNDSGRGDCYLTSGGGTQALRFLIVGDAGPA